MKIEDDPESWYKAASLSEDFLKIFNANFNESVGCWEWNGKLKKQDYGIISFKRHTILAHRMNLSLKTGIFPSREVKALHSCNNPPCVNPNHLRWGDQVDNMEDCLKSDRNPNKKLTHCANGHPFSGHNLTIVPKTSDRKERRKCKQCQNEAMRKHRLKKRSEQSQV